ncbi:MAG TPA: formylglycine-generating enzyme family protein [Thermotogota bacterium]|nr:MAG: Serine/threonine-protein kinase pkn1 [Thermotogota bacterium ADurb.Bin062]HOF24508.1 formylglycine-generating enzyme family protein [Thermotogota bacterium]HOS25809.1 formylglycine-generating enzyme family protein [Thermotogota bacterium]HPL39878.1 formylglycine-generating enzyme family protein [Thermotogota bacterium]HQI99799.1 formylglycine-generating enzyme family protein [Thermotogota bacterium]
MRELKCNNCGGTSILMKDNGRFVCEHCGVTYTKDQVDRMGAQIDVKVAVETGRPLEKQIQNGETWLKLGENKKAREVFEKTVDEYPMDYRGWYGLAKSYIYEGQAPEGNILRNFVLTAPEDVLTIIVETYSEIKRREEIRIAEARRIKEEEERKKREEEERRKREEEARKREEERRIMERQKALQEAREREYREAIEANKRRKKRKAARSFLLISTIIIAILAYTHSQRPELFDWLLPADRSAASFKSLEMVRVRKGSFVMGNTRNDSEGYSDEKPVHTVTLTYDYWIGKYEVTFKEYDAYCAATGKRKPDDEEWGRGTRPVINVSWWDAIGYCNWLSEREGLKKAYDSQGNLLDKNGKRTTDITKVEGYRLPTEAEWEYAARGGQNSSKYKYSGSNTVGDVAWHDSNSGNKTHPVGGKKPNELGIYDISGNVWEWCHDWFEYYSSAAQTNPTGSSNGAGRVNRGGSWYSYAQSCRVASRYYLTPVNGASNIGFRVSRTVF